MYYGLFSTIIWIGRKKTLYITYPVLYLVIGIGIGIVNRNTHIQLVVTWSHNWLKRITYYYINPCLVWQENILSIDCDSFIVKGVLLYTCSAKVLPPSYPCVDAVELPPPPFLCSRVSLTIWMFWWIPNGANEAGIHFFLGGGQQVFM